MADETGPTGVMTCDEVRDLIELFVLDALEPDEAARVEAHVAGCAGCAAERDRAAAAVGPLLALAPPVEVSDAFVDRVVASASSSSAAADPPAPTRAPAVPVAAPPVTPIPVVPAADAGAPARRHRRLGTRVLAVAAAVVLVALILTAVGAAVGSVFASDSRVAAPATRSAPLLADDGASVGSVAVEAGEHPTLVMVVDRVRPGVGYDCVVRGPDGELVTVGSWSPSEGPASWSVPLDPSLGAVDEVMLVGSGGTTLATATLS